MRRMLMLVCSVILLAATGGAAYASSVAVGFETPNDFSNGFYWAAGFEFVPTIDISVVELGIYDSGENGFALYDDDNDGSTAQVATHEVGIYDGLGNLLISAVVAPDDPIENFFRYTAIKPLQLQQGQTYYVLAEMGPENLAYDTTGFWSDSRLIVGDLAYIQAGVFTDPADIELLPGFENGLFGGNMKFNPSEVPVPSALFLLGSGFISLLGLKRTFRK